MTHNDDKQFTEFVFQKASKIIPSSKKVLACHLVFLTLGIVLGSIYLETDIYFGRQGIDVSIKAR